MVRDVAFPWWAVPLAALPIVLLAVQVLRSRPVVRSAWAATGAAALVGVVAFGLTPAGLGVGVLRGVWSGVWILLIVLPALLLFEVVERSGALDVLADAATRVAPTPGRRLLLLAFVLPAFLQGAAGFGAPIAMSAPLLVRAGMSPVAAVAACVAGYQWSVTFGSMATSYFIVEAATRLPPAVMDDFALRAALLLAAAALVCGFVVLTRGERSPGDRWRALVLGVVMGAVLVAVVRVQPALGSTTAGLAGLAVAWTILPDRGGPRPGGRDLAAATAPYLALTLLAGTGFGVPAVRALLERLPALAPRLPGSTAAFGFGTAAGPLAPAFRPLLHPAPYVLAALAVAAVVYRRRGWWRPGLVGEAVAGWWPRALTVAATMVGLTTLAAVATEAGMIAALAGGAVAALGRGFVLFASALGSFGSLITGSTAAGNALFAGLHAEVAVALGIAPSILLAALTAGGNVVNAITPAVALVGLAAVGASGREGEVIRRNVGVVALLTATTTALVVLQVLLA